MANAFLGQIALFPYSFAPLNWMDCAGQWLPIAQYTNLYALIGNAYGGDFQRFCLPDLQGRAPICFGPLKGGGTYAIGDNGGVEYVTLNQDTMPAHHHDLTTMSDRGTSNDPTGNVLARVGGGTLQGEYKGKIYNPGRPNVQLGTGASIVPVGGAGGSGPTQAHDNMQPSLVLRYCICVNGYRPS